MCHKVRQNVFFGFQFPLMNARFPFYIRLSFFYSPCRGYKPCETRELVTKNCPKGNLFRRVRWNRPILLLDCKKSREIFPKLREFLLNKKSSWQFLWD